MSRATDPSYLRFQYGDDERLQVRVRTHERYGESKVPFVDWVLGHVRATTGHLLIDVGSGPGVYHSGLAGVRVIAVDLSFGMLRKVGSARVQGDAQVLPLRHGCADRVMANHMLFHVADQRLALREMRRVLKPGGRVVLAANGRDSMARLFDLYREVALEVGVAFDESVTPGSHFSLQDLALVSEVFPNARVEAYADALVFPEPEPVLAYLASGAASWLQAEVRAAVFDALAGRIRDIIARDGAFRVPKVVGCFVADA